jgi:hypothetical protein
MENIEIIITAVIAGLGFLASTVVFIIKFVKAQKAKLAAEGHLDVKNVLLEFIQEAEKLTDTTGAEKKNFVMEKVNEYLKNNNVTADIVKIGESVDQIVDFTKKVNVIAPSAEANEAPKPEE